jgi:hypothetical protein
VKAKLATGCIIGCSVRAIFDKVSIASIGVAVQSGIPGTFKKPHGDVAAYRGDELDVSDWVCSKHLSELLCGVEKIASKRR